MIFQHWPLWAQITLAPFAFVALCLVLLLCGVVLARIVDEVMDQIEAFFVAIVSKSSPAKFAKTPTRLRIWTERHAHGYLCESCHLPTRGIVVVRLYDDTARVCHECASVLAPEVTA